ncbi:MAG: WD40 repeat protein, partial [Pirellulaceae bacterium]
MILAKGLLRVAFLGLIVPLTSSQGAESQGAESQGAESQSTTDEVSYYRQVLPILQTHCQGCHQPARRGGEYDMTDFSALLKGGESDERAILPGNADASYLLQQITPDGDQAEMPKGKPPLASAEIELIKKWIGQGAKDDTPAGAKIKYDTDNPPRYDAPPMITALDYSSDGKWLAVSGFHEVLLHEALLHEALHHEVLLQEAQDGSTKESVEPVARLIGMSERIESVVFSPDSAMLAVTGGTPGRMGEVQVWEIATRKLLQSIRVSFDTIRGASWSPDGKQLSFGCTDNTVRVIEVSSGKQVLYSASHTDWVLGTVFSAKGDQLVTCSRDGSVKLVEVKSQRMLGGLTGVQPGALKDDLHAVALHPTNNEVVAAGQDGIPTSFRLDAKPNGSKVRDFQRMPGRIFDIRFSRDGQKLFAGSSDKGSGHVFIYNSGGQLLKQAAGLASPVYAIACSADGKLVASGGADGVIRLNDVESGELVRQFVPIKLQAGDEQPRPIELTNAASTTARETLSLPDGLELESIVAFPESIQLKHRFDYRQLLLTGRLTSGEQIDLTRIMKLAQPVDSVIVSPTGVVRPAANGAGELVFDFQGKQVRIPTEVVGLKGNSAVSYIRDVQPMLSKLGCNAGTCHGSKDGKNGFKLSLRGYDPQFDHLALTDDLAARRINIARPERSLMMLKPTGISPHVGGVLMKPGQPSFELLRQWIRDGSKLDLEAPRVTSIDLLPKNPVLPRAKMAQQMIVMATYSDGSVRDVSAEAVISSGDIEVIQADSDGLMITLRRGESPVLARYEGSYTATTITVMGDRSGFTWQQLPVHNYIDPLVDKKLQRVKVAPSDLCTDAEFIRRVFLDLTGLPPNAPRVATFLADKRPAQQKRDDLVDDLVSSGDFIEHWTNKWADLLQVNRKFLGVRGSVAFRGWIKQSLSSNKPYDQFVYQILNAQGSTLENPPAAYYKVLREPTQTMENTTHLFLGVRFNCNKCHDHPFERWTQSQYYHLSAYFAQIGRKKHPVDADVEMIYDTGSGEVRHLQTGQNAAPEFPYSNEASGTVSKSRREELARWITSPKNAYFAKSYVNRLWGYMFGVGIIEPIDDIRAGNPATNPELLDALTKDFIESGFDVQHILKTICKSRTYQLSVDTNK